jgi:uncharacterized membrane protein YkvA (DUF1232 family)
MNSSTFEISPNTDAESGGRPRPLQSIKGWLRRPLAGAAEALGQHYLQRLAGVRGRLGASVTAIPDRMHLAAQQTRLVIELLEDVKAGVYRGLPWRSVALGSAAVLYSVSPADVIPDVIPGLGRFDDIALISIAVRLLQRDLRAYCRFKGYREEEYFDVAGAAAASSAATQRVGARVNGSS